MTLFAIFRLSRPVNVWIALLSVLVAALITGPLSPLSAVVLACVSAGLIMAAGNTINDYYDIAIDRINKPRRPLPSGQISPAAARRAALAEFAAGIVLSALISWPMFAMALGFSALIYLYAARLKRTVLWGNLAVSLSTAATFIYGGLAVRRPAEAAIPAAFAFFYHFGREIIKDMADVEGDRRGGAVTFPIRHGPAAAIALVRANFLILSVLTVLPFALGCYGWNYFLIVALGVYPVLGYVLFSLPGNLAPQHLDFLSNLLKADMLVGLLAIYFR